MTRSLETVEPPPARLDPQPPVRSKTDVLFVVAVALLLAVHVTIFFAVLVVAPVTPMEQRSLQLLHLPVEVARVLVLPFHALLLVSLFVLGRRAAGRWAGFGSMLAVLAVNLRADAAEPVFGPSVATGGWIAAALLAGAIAVLPRHRWPAAAMLGVATVFHALMVFALPAFLIALALFPVAPGSRRQGRAAQLLGFAGVWAVPAVVGQLLRLADLGPAAYLQTLDVFAAEFRPHALVGFLEQQRLLFAAWHFEPLLTFSLALFLFAAAGTGIVRYFMVPAHIEVASRPLAIARRFPMELWAAALTLVAFSLWWTFSGMTVIVQPNLPPLVAVAPLLTAFAYRGSKWLMTVNRFWAVVAVGYLVGLILARSTQLVFTLVQSFQR